MGSIRTGRFLAASSRAEYRYFDPVSTAEKERTESNQRNTDKQRHGGKLPNYQITQLQNQLYLPGSLPGSSGGGDKAERRFRMPCSWPEKVLRKRSDLKTSSRPSRFIWRSAPKASCPPPSRPSGRSFLSLP